VLDFLISLGIGLKMVGANPDNTMVALLYGMTSLFAMLIYTLVAWDTVRAAWLSFYRPPGPMVGVTETAC
jgi:hypothetical protein